MNTLTQPQWAASRCKLVRSSVRPPGRSFVLPFWMEFFVLLPLCFPPIFWDGGGGGGGGASFVRSALPPSRFSLALPSVGSSLPRCLTQHFQGRVGMLVVTFRVDLWGIVQICLPCEVCAIFSDLCFNRKFLPTSQTRLEGSDGTTTRRRRRNAEVR